MTVEKINEIFPNPTVKEVAFEIKYPNLFYIENKIGDLQIRIIEEFPESSLIFRAPIAFANIGPEGKFSLPPNFEEDTGKKIWEFKSEKGFRLNISSDSLLIVSQFHKTYNLDGQDKFRDIIEFIVENFLEIMQIPIFNRIGFRYIDECPLPTKDNETFKKYYDSVFPIERFNLSNVDEMDFKTVFKIGNYHLRYVESLQKVNDEYKLILDFDGFAGKIKSNEYLKITDDLHAIILGEFEKTINKPVLDHMRGSEG